MSQPEIERISIVGRTLTNLLQTRWVPYFHIEGLQDAFDCNVVMEFGADLLSDSGFMRWMNEKIARDWDR
jgi:hypothetical protein